MKRLRTLVLQRMSWRAAIFGAVWLALFAYAGRPLLVAAAAGGIAPALAWLALLVAAVLPILAVRRQGTLHLIGYVTLTIFSTLLVLVLLGDVVRLLFGSVDVRALSFGILGAAGALTLIGAFQARCPRVKRVRVIIDDLPPELDGYRIVQWSDVHVGPTIRRRFLENLVEQTNALEADAIAITGDLVDGPLDELRDHVAPLADLRAKDGVFFVTGNHEYYWRASEWIPALERLGITFLKNEHRRINARLIIAGVTDSVGRYTHKSDPGAALRGAPADAIKVLLAHRPQAAQAASKLGVHLQLSGHTHGGQFFPFNMFIRFFQPIVAGLHKVGATQLYVSRGTGYWGPPSRLGVHGEITVVELLGSSVPRSSSAPTEEPRSSEEPRNR